jgi:hypothetical protein
MMALSVGFTVVTSVGGETKEAGRWPQFWIDVVREPALFPGSIKFLLQDLLQVRQTSVSLASLRSDLMGSLHRLEIMTLMSVS